MNGSRNTGAFSNQPAAGASLPHESAHAQVAGTASYVDDIPEVRGTLHGAPILSTVAHGQLRGVDTVAAQALPGVRGLVLARDIPGGPMLASFAGDEPIFATDTVQYVGQVVGIVVADTMAQARRAAAAVQLDVSPLPAILSLDAIPIWPSESDFDAAADGDTKKLFVITGGSDGPDQRTWFEKTSLTFKKTCP